jgi:hypothetical protein
MHSLAYELPRMPLLGTRVNNVSSSPCEYTDAVPWRPTKEGTSL